MVTDFVWTQKPFSLHVFLEKVFAMDSMIAAMAQMKTVQVRLNVSKESFHVLMIYHPVFLSRLL